MAGRRMHHARAPSQLPTSRYTTGTSPPFCSLSFTLKHAQRYRASNLIPVSLLPGPREQTCDEIQGFLRPIINDLLYLWRYGMLVKTPQHPEGFRCSYFVIFHELTSLQVVVYASFCWPLYATNRLHTKSEALVQYPTRGSATVAGSNSRIWALPRRS